MSSTTSLNKLPPGALYGRVRDTKGNFKMAEIAFRYRHAPRPRLVHYHCSTSISVPSLVICNSMPLCRGVQG